MSGWSPKRAGFESGNSGNSGYGKPRKHCPAVVPDLWQYKLGLLTYLEEKGIEHYEKESGSIVANLPGHGWMEKTPEMLEKDYKEHVNSLCGREVYLIA